jgi:hypothetical protein
VTELVERRERKDYSDQEIDAGLTAYAICSGKPKRAAALLKEQTDFDVPYETIRSWAQRTHADRYERIRTQVAPKLQVQMADTHQALAQGAARIEAEAAEKLQKRLEAGGIEDKDLGNIYKNAAIVSGIHTEKAELLNGRPTSRTSQNADEIIRSLKSKGITVNGEVVSEETVTP